MANLLKQDNKLSFFLNLLIVLGIGVTVALLFFYVYLPTTTNHAEMLKAPDLVGKSEEEVARILEEKQLRYEIIDSTYNADLPPKAVLSQNPRANSDVKVNRKIYLTVNLGETPYESLPTELAEGKNNSLMIAVTYLRQKGFIIGDTISRRDQHKHFLGLKVNGKTFMKNELRNKHMAKRGDRVDIIVGDGKGIDNSDEDEDGLPDPEDNHLGGED